jgi:hypothetical protein
VAKAEAVTPGMAKASHERIDIVIDAIEVFSNYTVFSSMCSAIRC